MNVYRESFMRGGVLAIFLAAAGLFGAGAQSPGETFDSLVQKADDVIVGQCVAKKTVTAHGIFITTHEIRVAETLKGKSYHPGQTAGVVALGGSFSSPPLTQFVNNQPTIIEGEDVLLLLQNPPAPGKPAKSLPKELTSNARVVGGANGKFSIVTDPVDGKRKVVRIRCEDYGFMPEDRLLRTILRALEKGELQTTNSAELVDLGGGVRGPAAAKPVLDKAVQLTEAARLRRGVSPQEAADAVRKSGRPIPAPTLDEVKRKISNLVKK